MDVRKWCGGWSIRYAEAITLLEIGGGRAWGGRAAGGGIQ